MLKIKLAEIRKQGFVSYTPSALFYKQKLVNGG